LTIEQREQVNEHLQTHNYQFHGILTINAMKASLKMAIVAILLLLIITETCARRGKGSRRRKMKKQNSKVLFHTNPKRAEYYLNADVSPMTTVTCYSNVITMQGAQIIRASHFDYEFYLGHKVT